MIDIHLDQTTIMVGEKLSGTLGWHSSKSTMPNTIVLSIGWYTQGRGTSDYQIRQACRLDPNQVRTLQSCAIPFSFVIPAEGPITYNGSLFRVMWELRVSQSFNKFSAFSSSAQGNDQICPFQVILQQRG